MRPVTTRLAALLAASTLCPLLLALPAAAATGTAASPAATTPARPAAEAGQATTPPAAADPVLATVNGEPIRMSDVRDAARSLPPQARSLPPQVLVPILLDRMIDGKALAIEARKEGLQDDPAVKAEMQQAEERALQNALLQKEVAPQISEAAIKARYEAEYANKPGEEEVHARHILVKSESEAKDLIGQLDKGADFAALAKQKSTEPGAKDSGGDLGWFKKDEMLPAFSAEAFSLKDNQISQTPVHTQYGWHVIQVLGHRTAPPPTLAEVHDQIRTQLIQQGVQQAVKQARNDVKVVKFTLPGAAGSAEPAPPAGASPKPPGATTPAK
ncbi:MAG TPA: peptidylprolyl isomerase [Acetobacteraceae bacterium]|nr:peptidylprolyl isomerase [Acetobacteraceae bacterium]